jgi:outer membrane lipoprotein carrier protein
MLFNQLRRLVFVLLVFVTPLSKISLFSQPMSAKTDVSDPKAKALLDKVKKQYEGYQALESAFKLEISLAEQAKPEVQSGKFYQQGEKFRVDTGKDFIISDGKLIWQKVNNTVRITNVSNKSSDDNMMSPRDLLKIYEKKDYTYAITGEKAEGWSKKATLITFKPNNRRSDYTKIEVVIDQKTNYVVSMKVFERDQSHYKLNLDLPSINTIQDGGRFAFDRTKYPNLKVEDMRED